MRFWAVGIAAMMVVFAAASSAPVVEVGQIAVAFASETAVPSERYGCTAVVVPATQDYYGQ
jgi:3-deoxy-D-arabino-heptulosonate 7-phosphate (DAHP) synthase class II